MLQWLRVNIHQQGSVMTPAELIESATGKAPSPEPFLDYVEKKYSKLYNL
jgi:carboxypeptidase Taq